MKVTHDWIRKRASLNTACWDCYRCHRGCDGLRPCKRCVDLGRGPSCRDPAPNEKIPYKRKKPIPKDRGQTSCTVPEQNTHPQHFQSSIQPTALPDPDFNRKYQDLQPENNRQLTHLILDQPHSCAPYVKRRKQSHTPTREPISLLDDLQPESESIDHPQPTTWEFSPRKPTQITMVFNVPPSIEALIEEIRTECCEETADHRKKSTSEFHSLSVPDDMMHLTESFFTPFGLRDSTQPFVVFKHFVDHQALAMLLQEPNDTGFFCPIVELFLLTASPAFCALIQFAEEELLGLNCAKMMPERKPLPAEDRAILPYLCPQTSLRVSPILRVHPYWFMRNGLIFHADNTLQYFYAADGTISFVVLGVEKFTIKTNM